MLLFLSFPASDFNFHALHPLNPTDLKTGRQLRGEREREQQLRGEERRGEERRGEDSSVEGVRGCCNKSEQPKR